MNIKSFLSASLVITATALPGIAAAQDASVTVQSRPVPAIVEKWAAAWNSDDAQDTAALFTEDGVYEDFAFQAKFAGKEGVRTWVEITA